MTNVTTKDIRLFRDRITQTLVTGDADGWLVSFWSFDQHLGDLVTARGGRRVFASLDTVQQVLFAHGVTRLEVVTDLDL